MSNFKKLIYLIFIVFLVSCAENSEPVGDFEYHAKKGTIEFDEAKNSYTFIPAKKSEAVFEDLTIALAQESSVLTDYDDALVLEFSPKNDVTLSNNYATVTIAKNTKLQIVKFKDSNNSFITTITDDINTISDTNQITYDVMVKHNDDAFTTSVYKMFFFANKSFKIVIDKLIDFSIESKPIRFVKNDVVTIDNDEIFDYNYYSVESRDKLRDSIFKKYKPMNYKQLVDLFQIEFDKDEPIFGSRIFRKYFVFFVKPGEYQPEINDTLSDEDKDNLLGLLQFFDFGRYWANSYLTTSTINFKVQDPSPEPNGKILLYLPDEHIDYTKNAISNNEAIYFAVKFGDYSDITSFGSGLVTFVLTEGDYNKFIK